MKEEEVWHSVKVVGTTAFCRPLAIMSKLTKPFWSDDTALAVPRSAMLIVFFQLNDGGTWPMQWINIMDNKVPQEFWYKYSETNHTR